MALHVVTYDIADDRRRIRAAKALEDFGDRVQESVFDCDLEERRLLELRAKLIREIDQSLDSVRFYSLCKRCVGRTEVLGLGRIRTDREIIIV